MVASLHYSKMWRGQKWNIPLIPALENFLSLLTLPGDAAPPKGCKPKVCFALPGWWCCRADAAALILLLNHRIPHHSRRNPHWSRTHESVSHRGSWRVSVPTGGINGDFTLPRGRKFSKQTIQLERSPWKRSNITAHRFLSTPFLHPLSPFPPSPLHSSPTYHLSYHESS